MALTPEEKAAIKAEIERRKAAASKPETYVTDEQFAELEGLYNAAKKSASGNPNKKTPETLAFQRRYHELLPNEAKKIIGNNPKKTAKAIKLGLDPTDLEGNADEMFGERTEKYWQSVKKKPKEEPPVAEDTKLEETPTEPVTTAGPIEENPIQAQVPVKAKSPWWLQDIIQTAGAASDLARIKKYQPWQANPEVRLPDATFYDPTRELAANTEQANLAYQTQAAFTNPQQLAAASSVAQGQAAKNAADIMGRYNNLNVGLANQLSKERTDIMNTASQNKANLDTQLWDKYTVLNQQFDNSKNQARKNLRNSYISAITNRANTANLNSLYPQYAVDPSTGGFTYFQGDPTKIKAANKYDFDNDYAKALKITGNAENALAYLKLKNTGKLASDETADRTFPNTYPGTSSPQ